MYVETASTASGRSVIVEGEDGEERLILGVHVCLVFHNINTRVIIKMVIAILLSLSIASSHL